ncbi:zinc/iron-chelating domain-containing protein [Spirochaetia bacterium]|nr:zinc/iron-chelating domain-containing protein [Spirochaetia bacterium]
MFLSKRDTGLLAAEFDLTPDEFVKVYCRWVPSEGAPRLSLKEKSNYDCIFWDSGCSVYEKRPIQCITFPFWASNLRSAAAWDGAAQYCPGMGKGELHPAEYIESCVSRHQAVITQK